MFFLVNTSMFPLKINGVAAPPRDILLPFPLPPDLCVSAYRNYWSANTLSGGAAHVPLLKRAVLIYSKRIFLINAALTDALQPWGEV